MKDGERFLFKKKISTCIANGVMFSKQFTIFPCFHTTFIRVVCITLEMSKMLFVKYLLFYFVSYNDSFFNYVNVSNCGELFICNV